MPAALDVFLRFLRLGCTSFGGPVAHLAYFRREFVERRAWLDDDAFAECVALTQLLPGPSSSQTGMLVGWLRAGPLGAVAAWIGFTLPSAAIMTAFALLPLRGFANQWWFHALLVIAAGFVAAAIAGTRATLAPDLTRGILAAGVMGAALALPSPYTAPLAIGIAALAGARFLHGRIDVPHSTLDLRISPRIGFIALALFAIALATAFAARTSGAHEALLCGTLFDVGSLVFGGGHVVLPLLQTQVANAGMLDARTLLAGYGAVQAMPGPLFSIAAYVGGRAYGGALGITGACLATLAIFLPSFFLLTGVAPFYRILARNRRFRSALAGANAGVVGLLAAIFVTPVASSTVHSPLDALAVATVFTAIVWRRTR